MFIDKSLVLQDLDVLRSSYRTSNEFFELLLIELKLLPNVIGQSSLKLSSSMGHLSPEDKPLATPEESQRVSPLADPHLQFLKRTKDLPNLHGFPVL